MAGEHAGRNNLFQQVMLKRKGFVEMKDIKTLGEIIKQLLYIMTGKQKRNSIFLFVIILIGAVFEMLGVSVILPFIQALLSPEELLKYPYIVTVINIFKITNTSSLIILIGIGIIILYLIKNLYLFFATYMQVWFRSAIYNELSIRLLNSFMKRPYTYFLDANSAEIISGIGFDASGIRLILDCVLQFLRYALSVLLIGVLIIYTDPIMAVGMLVLAVICFVGITFGFKKKLKVMGINFRDAELTRSKYAYQAITGIKEVMVMQRREYFVHSFEQACKKSNKAEIAEGAISAIPERLIEAICIGGMIGIVCIRVAVGMDVATFIPKLAVFAVAAFNMLPAVSKMIGNINGAIYHRSRLTNAYRCLREADEYISAMEEYSKVNYTEQNEEKNIVTFKEKLEICNVDWKYNNSMDNVLDGVSLTITKGESVAFIGTSGAGKTTLADVVLGLLHPQQGTVKVDGVDIFAIPKEWSKIIGYVPQSVFLIDDTIRANVTFGIEEQDVNDDLVWQALEQAQLKLFVESLPKGIHTIVGDRGIKFSGGQRQRIAIARTLYYNPDILVLDEATSALDNETETAVMEAIDALSGYKTLIIVAHRMSTIRNCDKIYEIKNGQAFFRTKEEIFGE